MKPQDHLRTRARADIESIFLRYAEHADMRVAERFVDAVFDVIDDLVEHPWTGRSCNTRLPELAGLRSRTVTVFDACVVFYVVEARRVEVLRILHGARELERLLLDRDEPDAVHETASAEGGLYPTSADTAWRVAC